MSTRRPILSPHRGLNLEEFPAIIDLAGQRVAKGRVQLRSEQVDLPVYISSSAMNRRLKSGGVGIGSLHVICPLIIGV